MHTSKLFILLRGLRPEEIHWFQKFLKSPFYNNASANSPTIRLFEHLKKHFPELASPKLSKEIVFKKLFPNEKFKVQKLRKVMFELANLTEEFFVTMHLRNKDFQREKILVKEFGERNLYSQFEKGTKGLIKELEALPYRDTFFYKNIFELNYNYSNHQATNRQKLNGQLLKNATEHLDYFYLLQKQQLDFAVKSHEKLFKEKVKLSTLKQAETELQTEPVFNIYELINKAISKSDNDENYFEIESLFKNEIEKLGKNDKIVILKILLNYSSRQINKGEAKYFSNMFSLYKFGLEQELFIVNNKIGEVVFSNITTVALNEKEFIWVESFINNYKKYLPKSVKDDASFIALGFMFYTKKEYSKTIDLLLNHSFQKPLQILRSRAILLRTYFELFLLDQSYYDLLFAQTQSFEKFLRRNEIISNDRKENYLNFIFYTKKIVNTHLKNIVDENLYEKIKSSDSIAYKFWLLKKLKP